ncbi:MAG: hypothetical protein PHN49_10305 [Candidatus Omnitrophica bacterium]|nr:hypothetical protein [Candidatus Omnitrophota bacterium]MDD5672021.1 hypothetical protein [Candidatus Omnitrophota bacterium]
MWRIGEILIQKKLISWDDLAKCLQEQSKTHEFLGEILVRKGLVPKTLFYKALADQFNLKFLDLKRTHINPKAVEMIPKSIAQKYLMVPIDMRDDTLIVGISDPLKAWPADEIKHFAKVKEIRSMLCLPEEIEQAIKEVYSEAV